MSLSWRLIPIDARRRPRVGAWLMVTALGLAVASCGSDAGPTGTSALRLASIDIDGGSRSLERGSVVKLTATAIDTAGKTVPVPFIWTSSADSVVSIGRDGQLTAGVVGTALVTASALGVTSAAIQIQVVWQGPAKITVAAFNPPLALSPGGSPVDSIRVQVTTLTGAPAPGARVAFSVKDGGGTISPASPSLAIAGNSGIAAAKWTLGPSAGTNTVVATVVGADSQPISWVANNPVSFTVKSYAALAVVQGDGQTASILAPVAVAPVVKLVDTAGKPRAAVPVTFSPTGNGRVANSVVSTAADGSASPGIWTLGDATGEQQLIVTVEGAKISLHATATGTSVRYKAERVATGQAATCAIASDQVVSCFGQAPQIGTGSLDTNQFKPTPTAGGIHFTAVSGGGAHFCGTSTDLSIYCWGISSFVDSTGATNSTKAPTRLQSNIAWLQVSAGGQHNCAVANDHSAYCWGIDTSGQLGDGATTRQFTPRPVFGGFKFSSITSGNSHTCGILLDATAVCWGLNASGQIGDGTTTTRLSPTAISGGQRWKALAAGANWTCGLSTEGTPSCWGSGTGRTTPTSYSGAPVFASLSVGAAHACALTGDGQAYCWGENSSGQLGDSTTISRAQPAPVVTQLRFASISAGFEHTCGITTDGFLACWGRNVAGELGFETVSVQVTPRFIVIGTQP